jgi:hypothetical protein
MIGAQQNKNNTMKGEGDNVMNNLSPIELDVRATKNQEPRASTLVAVV